MKTETIVKFGLLDNTMFDPDIGIMDIIATGFDEEINPANILINEDDLQVKNYATFEHNQYKLDGDFYVMGDEYDTGIWSNDLSNEDGSFMGEVSIEIYAGLAHQIPGLTILFDQKNNVYPETILVQYFESETGLVAERKYTNTNSKFEVIEAVNEWFTRVKITFDVLNKPFQRLRVNGIKFGVEHIFDKTEIVNCSITESEAISPEEDIPLHTITLEAISEDIEFDPLNPTGIYSLLQKNQKLTLFEKVIDQEKTQMVYMGDYYLDEWNINNTVVTLKGYDLLGITDDYTFQGDDFLSNWYLSTAVDEMLRNSVYDTGIYILHYDNPIVKGLQPPCSIREGIRNAVASCGNVLDRARYATMTASSISIERIINSKPKVIGLSQKALEEEIEYKRKYTDLLVEQHNPYQTQEETEGFSGAPGIGYTGLKLSTPLHTLTKIEPDGAFRADAISVWSPYEWYGTATTNDNIKVSGFVVKDDTSIIPYSYDHLPGAEKNQLELSDNPFISSRDATDKMYDLIKWYNDQNVVLTFSMPYEFEKFPISLYDTRVKPPNHVNVYMSDRVYIDGIVQSLTYDTTTKFAKIVVVGHSVILDAHNPEHELEFELGGVQFGV